MLPAAPEIHSKLCRTKAQSLTKRWQNGVPGSSGAAKTRSRGFQGTSRGGPGARGVPSGAPGLDFGAPRAPFWVPFWSIFWYVFLYFLVAISASFFDAVLDPFGVHFWTPKACPKSLILVFCCGTEKARGTKKETASQPASQPINQPINQSIN